MAKELPYFKFEPSEWMFGRIQKQPADVQGNFINLCCKYWHKLGEYAYSDACLDFGNNFIDGLISNKLIGNESGYIFIQFLDIQLDECQQLSKKQSVKGLKSAAARAARRQQDSTAVELRSTTVQLPPTEEKRREEKRVIHTPSPSADGTYKKTLDLDQRMEVFKNEVGKFIPTYEKKMLNEFFAYWTEPNTSKTKMKFEMQKTWELNRRLATWNRNNQTNKFNFTKK